MVLLCKGLDKERCEEILKLKHKARYEGMRMADTRWKPISIEELDNRLLELFFIDQSIQNRVLKMQEKEVKYGNQKFYAKLQVGEG